MPVSPQSLANLRPDLAPRWQPGHSGNPSGRSKLEFLVREHLEKDNARGLKSLIGILYEMAHEKGKNAVAAAKLLLDRGYGIAQEAQEKPEGGLVINVVTGVTKTIEPLKANVEGPEVRTTANMSNAETAQAIDNTPVAEQSGIIGNQDNASTGQTDSIAKDSASHSTTV